MAILKDVEYAKNITRQVLSKIRSACNTLGGVVEYYLIGFCLGGYLANLNILNNEYISKIISVHGLYPKKENLEVLNLKFRPDVLMLDAQIDDLRKTTPQEFHKTLKEYDITWFQSIYSKVIHGWSRPPLDPNNCVLSFRRSWTEIFNFLKLGKY